MLSMKAKYGLRAALQLSRQPERFQPARDIAREAGVPLAFLENILRDLRGYGLIETRRGAAGGYRLAKAPQDIYAGNVIRALDGMLAPIRCASRFQYKPCDDCRDPDNCDIRHLMIRVRDEIAAVLDQQSLADLSKGHPLASTEHQGDALAG